MLRHHLLTSYRNLRKHKTYTVINITGLAIGLASCLLIALFLYHELSYDRFHEASPNIYRINTIYTDNSGTATPMANTPPALVPQTRGTFPEVRRSTQLRYTMRTLLERDDQRFYENRGFYADSLFLEMFTFPLASGDPNTALDHPRSVVLTQETATKYFGTADPIGETLTMNNEIPLTVTGIFQPIPSTSHLQFDFLVSFSTYEIPDGYLSDLTSWSWLGFLSYVELHDGSDAAAYQGKLNQAYREIQGHVNPFQAIVQPLEDIYFGSGGLVDDLASNLQSGNLTTVYALGIVALLILLIASFNFANLSVAVSGSRSKEIGLRSVLGADKRGVVGQLLTEPVVLAFASLLLAYLLASLVFPVLQEGLGWDFSIDGTLVAYSLPFALAITGMLGLLAGLYPAVMLSSRKAMLLLKGNLGPRGRSPRVRKALIATQFCISISLVAATLVINKQLQHLADQELGFDEEQVVVLKVFPQDMTNHYEAFKDRLLQNNHFVGVSRSERAMGEPWPVNAILVDGQDPSQSKRIMGNQVGYGYLETMGIELVEGRAFSEATAQDATRSIIISEQTVDYLGLENPIGQQVHYFSIDGPRTIIGVVEDFNFLSLHHAVSPTALIMPFVGVEYLYVRLSQGPLGDKLAALETAWHASIGDAPLDFHFMDERLNELYVKEQNLALMISGFSALAIVLASLGLYGLIAFAVNRRKKEVGIRKVLGASLPSLLLLFSRQYVALVATACVIAIPVIQYVLGLWLEGFVYRIEISWWIYGLSTLILLLVAIATISHQALRAALVNPVHVLQDE